MIEKILRKLPAFKGKQRLARALFNREINDDRDIIINGKYNCVYKVPNIKENIGFELFVNGVYEQETIAFIVGKLPVNGSFVDIGANIGAICVPVCKQRSDVKAIAVEASTKVFNYLAVNISTNGIKNCAVFNKAVSDKDGETVSFFSPNDLFGKGSMAAVFTNDAEAIETITVDTIIEESNLDRVDFIKIDVEGFEYFAFKGAEKLLTAPNAPDILFEFVDWAEALTKTCKPGDAQRILLEYGYQLWQIEAIGKLTAILSPVLKGSIMIWATKAS